jgi:hypothetical protein
MYTALVLGRTQINVAMRGFDKAVWSLNSGISKGQMTVQFSPRFINFVPPNKYLYKCCCEKVRYLGLAFVCFCYVSVHSAIPYDLSVPKRNT